MANLAEKLAGKFIVLDGPDGSGKSTQLALLAEWLAGAGVDVVTARDPGGTEIGDRIRQILLDGRHADMAVPCETMLYMASRAQLVAEIIAPVLAAGKCVLCDRYVSATLAYQGAGGAELADIRTVADVATGAAWPDLTIILDLPAEAGLERLPESPDRMESKDLDFHRKVRQSFLDQASGEPGRYTVVSAAGSIDEIQQRLRRLLESWEFA